MLHHCLDQLCYVQPYRYTPLQVAAGLGVAATVAAGGVAAVKNPDVADALSGPAERVWDQITDMIPPLHSHPKLVLGGLGCLALGGAFLWR